MKINWNIYGNVFNPITTDKFRKKNFLNVIPEEAVYKGITGSGVAFPMRDFSRGYVDSLSLHHSHVKN